MAEFATAFGIVTGIIGLVPLCGKGYTFIESIVTADRHAEEQLIRIQIQQWVSACTGLLHNSSNSKFSLQDLEGMNLSLPARLQTEWLTFSAWARVWEIPTIVPHRKTESKIQRFVDKDKKLGYNILKTFSFISNMFADVRDLEEKYGLHLKQRDPVSIAHHAMSCV